MDTTYTVYHVVAKDADGRLKGGFGVGPPADFPADYQKVATVVATGCDHAFLLTNHIDAPWWRNPGVAQLDLTFNTRSTSCGDIIQDPDGRLWRCEPAGWTEVVH